MLTYYLYSENPVPIWIVEGSDEPSTRDAPGMLYKGMRSSVERVSQNFDEGRD